MLPFRQRPSSAPAGGPGSFSSASRGAPHAAWPSGTATSRPRPSEASRFRDLISPHVGAAYSLARYLARDAVVAEDIAQEALLKAFRGADSLRGDEVKPWLMTIVRNTYFDWRRRDNGRTVTGPAADVAMAETPADEVTAEDSLIRQGDVAALRRAVAELPEPFREALVLREFEEMSYRDIAEVTGVPMGTVMSRLARARRMLGERMGVLEVSP
ncbi:MAG TPA: sigma-70 family RNA polymerase sigma factor [Caulobacteraceae bacterium]|nr:sigma-70 family RNA polymerase sigma factor [Caulobacteraceae bacterium]